jgi:hypothetical protein
MTLIIVMPLLSIEIGQAWQKHPNGCYFVDELSKRSISKGNQDGIWVILRRVFR